MKKLLAIIEQGEGISSGDFNEMVRRNPGVSFVTQANMFTTMRTRVGIDALTAELVDKVSEEVVIGATAAVVVTTERINKIQEAISVMESALYEITPNLTFMENVDVTKFKLISVDSSLEVIEYQNKPIEEILLLPEVVLNRVVRKTDADKYISWIEDTGFFDRMFNSKPTLLDIVSACQSGYLKEHTENEIVKLKSELLSFKPQTLELDFDSTSYMSVVRLVQALNEL